jgi:hypothetical protein
MERFSGFFSIDTWLCCRIVHVREAGFNGLADDARPHPTTRLHKRASIELTHNAQTGPFVAANAYFNKTEMSSTS